MSLTTQSSEPASPQAIVTVWSDYVDPFCYLELPVLDRLERELGPRLKVEWRPFELRPDPEALLDMQGAQGDYLRSTWDRSIAPLAEIRGLPMKLPPVQPRSQLAHQAALYARTEGKFNEMHRTLFRAFFKQGADIGKVEILIKIAQHIGLNAEGLRFSLELNEYRSQIEAERAAGTTLRIEAVPVLLVRGPATPIERATRLEGTVDYKSLRRAVDRVLQGIKSANQAAG